MMRFGINRMFVQRSMIIEVIRDRTFEKEMLLNHFYCLTEKQTKWVVMHYYYGLSKKDIAEMENITLRKVRSWGELAMKKCLLKQEI